MRSRTVEAGLQALAGLAILLGLAVSAFANPPDCVHRTRDSGHVIIPAGAWQGDPIHVEAVSASGECVGEGTLTRDVSVVRMWGWDEYSQRGLHENEPVKLVTTSGELAMRLGGDDRWYAGDLRWQPNMIALATEVTTADSLFAALDSLEVYIREGRLAYEQQIQELQSEVARLTQELDNATGATAEQIAELEGRLDEVDHVFQLLLHRVREIMYSEGGGPPD